MSQAVQPQVNFQAVSDANPLPVKVLSGGGTGGVGDASAANQLTEIARLEAIRDRLPSTPHNQPLTDTQLRATAVPVSAASLPLPYGAATETTLAALNTKVPEQNVEGLLPVDTLGTPGTPRVQATSGTAASIVLTTTCRRISMYATTGTWYSMYATATTTSHYIAAGERLDFDVLANTTISVLQESTAGSIRITELL